jgi:hypothetical protein
MGLLTPTADRFAKMQRVASLFCILAIHATPPDNVSSPQKFTGERGPLGFNGMSTRPDLKAASTTRCTSGTSLAVCSS